jgi:titin
LVALLGFAASAQAATFVVTTKADSGTGSLRSAIAASNGTVGPNEIDFAIGTGSHTITPLSALPAITHQVVVDGTTQPGFAGVPLIRLDGSSTPAATGLSIAAGAGGSTVEGLQIVDWSVGIGISGAGSNVVSGNYVGTSGGSALPNGVGVLIHKGSAGNTIGGTVSSAGNVISGNSSVGVELTDSGTGNNLVEGNAIGTNAGRKAAVANGTGVLVTGAAGNNTIGGTSAAARNLISGNTNDGVDVNGANKNHIVGNYIGTNAAGAAALANGSRGVFIAGGASSNTVGGSASGEQNLISGNGFLGVDVAGVCRGPAATGNVIEGNRIGTNAAGSAAVNNFQYGVLLEKCSSGTRVGGTAAGAGNLIAGAGEGVAIYTSDGNTIEGNDIGTNAGGTASIANGFGIQLFHADNNTIGGTTAAARNVISGNSSEAIRADAGANGNTIEGNYIGTNSSGLGALGNGVGVDFYGTSSGNMIGGTTAGARNVISGNSGDAVGLFNPGTTGNTVEGNYIGVDSTGSAPLPNSGPGVDIVTGATNNLIGGTTAGAANLIANNSTGVAVDGKNTIGNSILGNSIFASSTLLGITLTSGGNNSEPAPTITAVFKSGGTTTISGVVAAGTHRVEVFQNPSCSDPEGQKFVGATATSTTSWSITVPAISTPALTATSTDTSTGDTSQFSQCATNP